MKTQRKKDKKIAKTKEEIEDAKKEYSKVEADVISLGGEIDDHPDARKKLRQARRKLRLLKKKKKKEERREADEGEDDGHHPTPIIGSNANIGIPLPQENPTSGTSTTPPGQASGTQQNPLPLPEEVETCR